VRVALTHASGRLEGLAARLGANGHEVVRVPLVAIVPFDDDATRAAARALLGLAWHAFASRSAVEAWLALGLPVDGARIAALGPATRAALDAQGARGVLEAVPATADALVATLARRAPRGATVGVVQGRRARPNLATGLRRAGFDVHVATVYDTVTRPWPAGLSVDAVVVASPSAVAALPAEVGAMALLVAIGPTTAEAVRARGWEAREAAAPTSESVAAAVDAAAAASGSARRGRDERATPGAER
jgi:uroporphyrinogen-III synthase